MLVALASIILAIVFAFRAYNASMNDPVLSVTAENIRIAGILAAVALALTILGVIVSFFTYGSLAMWSPKNVMGNNILFMVLAFIIGAIMIAALLYAWIGYTDVMKTAIATDALIVAIAISIAILSPFFTKGGLRSIPIIGDVIYVDNKMYTSNDGTVVSETTSDILSDDSLFIPKLSKKK